MKRIAIYPGTFDPITYGHIDIIKRAINIFDFLIVAVAHNPRKNPLFTVEERLVFMRKSLQGLKNIEIDSFNILLIDYARQKKAGYVIKGLRAVSDFEFELQMGLTNRRLDPNLETIYLMPSEEFSFVSSRIIKEVAHLQGNVKSLVPPVVLEGLKKKFKQEKNNVISTKNK